MHMRGTFFESRCCFSRSGVAVRPAARRPCSVPGSTKSSSSVLSRRGTPSALNSRRRTPVVLPPLGHSHSLPHLRTGDSGLLEMAPRPSVSAVKRRGTASWLMQPQRRGPTQARRFVMQPLYDELDRQKELAAQGALLPVGAAMSAIASWSGAERERLWTASAVPIGSGIAQWSFASDASSAVPRNYSRQPPSRASRGRSRVSAGGSGASANLGNPNWWHVK